MKEIDAKLAAMPTEISKVLCDIRQVILELVPDATEVITYSMPGFYYKKKYLVAYEAFKGHMSIFPGSGAIASCAADLDGFVVSKGTVQFTLDNPLPLDIVRKLVLARVAEIDSKKK